MTKANDPAFPPSVSMGGPEGREVFIDGLTKREEFSKAAIQGLLANSELREGFMGTKIPSSQTVATWAIEQADALIAELNKKDN